MLRAFLAVVVVMALGLIALGLTHPLPDRSGLMQSTGISASATTRLGAALLPLADSHPGLSGVVSLADGPDALAARVLLARSAQASIDVQYYIWQADTTGWLLLDELRVAADRGVRVRLLLDDNGITGLDPVLAALSAHPLIEVRLFNPYTFRHPKTLSYAFDFARLNRRMHNKSMTVDGIVTILGGRNIGDIYFAYGAGTAYFDLDVLGVGPVAASAGADFDRYWASDSAWPVELILPEPVPDLALLERAGEAARKSLMGSDYLATIAASPLIRQMLDGGDIFEWTQATLISDDPAKGLGLAAEDNLLLGRLEALITGVQRRLDVVSAYLIPGRTGSSLFRNLVANGREVRLLTNALEATDVPVVHSAWMRYRAALVTVGVTVLELRARRGDDGAHAVLDILTGSTSSLHAKTFAIDEERIFIGSFNFDPRSATLNTEMGVLIESPRIAKALARKLDERALVHEVRPNGSGGLEWHETAPDGSIVVHRTEPNASLSRRVFVKVASWLPIEWML